MRKNTHSVFPQNRFGVKGAIRCVFPVSALIRRCCVLLGFSVRCLCMFIVRLVPPLTRCLLRISIHAAVSPSWRLPPLRISGPIHTPYIAIILFLLCKNLLFRPVFPRFVLKYTLVRHSQCRATEQGVYRVCKMASRSGSPRHFVCISGPCRRTAGGRFGSAGEPRRSDEVRGECRASVRAYRAAAAIRLPLEWRRHQPGFRSVAHAGRLPFPG